MLAELAIDCTAVYGMIHMCMQHYMPTGSWHQIQTDNKLKKDFEARQPMPRYVATASDSIDALQN